MNSQVQPRVERRINQRSNMTADQFKDFTMQSLEEGKRQFTEIKCDVAVLTGNVSTLAAHIETLTTALAENTDMTKKTAELAQKTADDTAGLVRLAKFGEATADVVTTGTRGASKVSKLLTPILIVGAILTAIWHGEVLRWEDILEAIAK